MYVIIFGAFENLRKATTSFVLSVCLSVGMEHLGSHRTDFLEILYLSIFRISLEKFQIPLISAENNGYFT